MLGQTAAAASLALPWGTVRAGRISFPANRFKNWLFRVPLRTGSSSTWRLNSALPGVGQRRQGVRKNVPFTNVRNSAIFSQDMANGWPCPKGITGGRALSEGRAQGLDRAQAPRYHPVKHPQEPGPPLRNPITYASHLENRIKIRYNRERCINLCWMWRRQ